MPALEKLNGLPKISAHELRVPIDRSRGDGNIAAQSVLGVSAYAIDAATGALMPLAGSPFASGMEPIAVTVSPNGRFAYAANYVSHNLSAFNIDAGTGR